MANTQVVFRKTLKLNYWGLSWGSGSSLLVLNRIFVVRFGWTCNEFSNAFFHSFNTSIWALRGGRSEDLRLWKRGILLEISFGGARVFKKIPATLLIRIFNLEGEDRCGLQGLN